MSVSNRVLAAIYRIMAALISIFAILSDFGVFKGNIASENIFYFTIISNILCFMMFSFLSVKTINEIKLYGIKGSTSMSPHIKGSILISIILTMTVYHFILIPYGLKMDPSKRLELADIILHYIVPCLTIFDLILFDDKKRFKMYDPLIWIFIPLMYVIFIYVQAGHNFIEELNCGMDKYVYAFLNLELLGKQAVESNIIKITAILIAIGYFLYGIDRIRLKKDEKFL